MSPFKNKLLLNIILIFSITALSAAYFIQFILGHKPCNLCLIERVPYALSLILIIINYTTRIDEKFIILLLILIFTFSFLISIYHFGIEQGYLEESAVCGLKNAAEIISKEELLLQLSKPFISCKDVTFRIFGLSLTSINVIVSILITIILIKTYTKNEKNKR